MSKRTKKKDHTNASDLDLIKMIRSGEEKAINILMERYKGMVRAKAGAMFLIGGEREDLLQEGMIGLYSAIRDYNEQKSASFHSFADLCVSRQMYTAIESSKRQKHIPLNNYTSLYASLPQDTEGHMTLIEVLEAVSGQSPEEIVITEEEAKRIDRAIGENLSAMEREVWNLHLLGHGYIQIATMLDKPPKSVDNTLQRVRKKLKVIMQQ